MTLHSGRTPIAPVLVIGSGPVGQTAALLLASWRIPVVLLDARPERDPVGSKAICQQRDVLDIWSHVGAGDQIAAEGVTWTRARTFYRDRELFCHGFVDRGSSPFPPFVNISQARTEQILDERIAEQPLIDVRWGHRVTGLEQDGDGVRLTCAVGEPWEADRVVTLTGSYALACVGARGELVRGLLGLRFDGSTFGDQFLICDIRTEVPGWRDERRFYFDPVWNPGRQVLIHPCPDSTFRIDWQVPPEYDLAVEEASGALDRRIRQIIGGRDYEIVWKSQYRFHARLVDRMRVGRVLVAGDAAHLVSPFGARGLNSGVPDAENAAWKLAYVLHGWAGDSLLDTYHEERHAAAAENLAVTSATMRFLVPRDGQERALRREILQAAADDTAARARVDSGRLAEPFWYVDSPLTTPCPTRPFGGRPDRGEAPTLCPGVLIPDVSVRVPSAGEGGATRLRLLARSALSVLIGPGVTRSEVEPILARFAAPTAVFGVEDLASGGGRSALGIGAREVWLLRPDAHVAAMVASPDHLEGALARMRLVRVAPDSVARP